MTLKHSLCTAALAVPLLIAGVGPSAAHSDVGFDVGFGSPYYGMYPYDPYYGYGLSDPFYDPYDDIYFGARFDVDDDGDIIEPAAAPAEPAPCVKTNVKNFKNACPR